MKVMLKILLFVNSKLSFDGQNFLFIRNDMIRIGNINVLFHQEIYVTLGVGEDTFKNIKLLFAEQKLKHIQLRETGHDGFFLL